MKPIIFSFVDSLPKGKDIARIVLLESKETEVTRTKTGGREIRIGIDSFKKMTRRRLQTLFRRVINIAKQNHIRQLSIDMNDFAFANLALAIADIGEMCAVNMQLANYEFNRYKTKPKEGWNGVEKIFIKGAKSRDMRDGFRRGQIIATETNKMRDLANTPGGEMTPAVLARAAMDAADGTDINVQVLGSVDMELLGMGGILGVGKGSDSEPKFIIMEYMAGDLGQKPIVLVGKGITFDTGGLNIKPGNSMEEMHMDMSGGAAVIHAITAAAKLGIKRNIVALVPAAENMPSGRSYRVGDILRTMNGKTIEIGHTDAEGRVVLADALEYSKRYKPEVVIDVATLTMGPLGQKASSFFATDEMLEKKIRNFSEKSGDYIWPLPLWEEYEGMIKGTFADVTNSSKTRGAGTIEGAMFLWQFIKGTPWVHIDIGSRIGTADGDFLAKGSTGEPVRLLVELLLSY
ncbi:MAG: leucyl aminopeptidase family protein [Patescibacteria group bacterium]